MRLLIDTHTLLWADERPRRIAQPLHAAMRDVTNEVVVSAASIWEIAIKRATGKLRFDRPIVAAVLALGFEILPDARNHAELAGALLRHHNDPFDRLIIAGPIWRGWFSAPRIGSCSPMGWRYSASAELRYDRWRQSVHRTTGGNGHCHGRGTRCRGGPRANRELIRPNREPSSKHQGSVVRAPRQPFGPNNARPQRVPR